MEEFRCEYFRGELKRAGLLTLFSECFLVVEVGVAWAGGKLGGR